MIGYIGMGLLMFAYVVLVTKWSKFFIPLDILATLVLTIHAYIIWDIPFLIVNAFIDIFLIIKFFKREMV